MALAWIGICVKSNNSSFLDTIYNIAPHRLDSRLWQGDYVLNKSTGFDGIEYVSMSLFFNEYSDRISFKSALGGVNGFIHAGLPGSFIKESTSYHDELKPNGTPIMDDIPEYKEIVT